MGTKKLGKGKSHREFGVGEMNMEASEEEEWLMVDQDKTPYSRAGNEQWVSQNSSQQWGQPGLLGRQHGVGHVGQSNFHKPSAGYAYGPPGYGISPPPAGFRSYGNGGTAVNGQFPPPFLADGSAGHGNMLPAGSFVNDTSGSNVMNGQFVPPSWMNGSAGHGIRRPPVGFVNDISGGNVVKGPSAPPTVRPAGSWKFFPGVGTRFVYDEKDPMNGRFKSHHGAVGGTENEEEMVLPAVGASRKAATSTGKHLASAFPHVPMPSGPACSSKFRPAGGYEFTPNGVKTVKDMRKFHVNGTADEEFDDDFDDYDDDHFDDEQLLKSKAGHATGFSAQRKVAPQSLPSNYVVHHSTTRFPDKHGSGASSKPRQFVGSVQRPGGAGVVTQAPLRCVNNYSAAEMRERSNQQKGNFTSNKNHYYDIEDDEVDYSDDDVEALNEESKEGFPPYPTSKSRKQLVAGLMQGQQSLRAAAATYMGHLPSTTGDKSVKTEPLITSHRLKHNLNSTAQVGSSKMHAHRYMANKGTVLAYKSTDAIGRSASATHGGPSNSARKPLASDDEDPDSGAYKKERVNLVHTDEFESEPSVNENEEDSDYVDDEDDGIARFSEKAVCGGKKQSRVDEQSSWGQRVKFEKPKDDIKEPADHLLEDERKNEKQHFKHQGQELKDVEDAPGEKLPLEIKQSNAISSLIEDYTQRMKEVAQRVKFGVTRKQEVNTLTAERERLMKLHEEKLSMKKRHWEEEQMLDKEFAAALRLFVEKQDHIDLTEDASNKV